MAKSMSQSRQVNTRDSNPIPSVKDAWKSQVNSQRPSSREPGDTAMRSQSARGTRRN